MPKEVVRGTGPIFGPDSPAIPILDVRWSRDKEFVEIGARIVHAADHSNYVPTEQERPGAAGQPIQGTFMSLDRHAINKLIRDLRRARDQAFGKDE